MVAMRIARSFGPIYGPQTIPGKPEPSSETAADPAARGGACGEGQPFGGEHSFPDWVLERPGLFA